tara:strand:+ start:212 stop:517 length:306 start_codon:yes stop_codon:yes gene_type:complete
MSTDMLRVIKLLQENKKELLKLHKENKEYKKILSVIQSKIDSIESKIQEFEIIFDAADIIEEHREEEENKYNTEWSPYEDEDFIEEYNNYDDDDDDVVSGY